MSSLGPIDPIILSFPAGRPPYFFLAAVEQVERRKDVRTRRGHGADTD